MGKFSVATTWAISAVESKSSRQGWFLSIAEELHQASECFILVVTTPKQCQNAPPKLVPQRATSGRTGHMQASLLPSTLSNCTAILQRSGLSVGTGGLCYLSIPPWPPPFAPSSGLPAAYKFSKANSTATSRNASSAATIQPP